MSQLVCGQPRSTDPAKNAFPHSESSTHSTADRNGNSVADRSSNGGRRAAAASLMRLLEADAVDLRNVGDAIRVHPELESLVLELCNLLVLAPEDPASSVEEAAIVLGKERLRTVVHVWSANQWAGEVGLGPQPANRDVAAGNQNSGRVPGGTIDGRPASFLWSEFSAEVLDLASFFHWARRDLVSFVNGGGENHARRLDLELRHASHLTDLLVRDLLSLISLLNPAVLSPEQEAAFLETSQVRR